MRLLFATRFVRLFAYGALSVVLVFYLVEAGLSELQTGILLTLTLLGDTIVSLALTADADRIGRRRMLIAGAALMAGAGVVMASTTHFWLLLLAATAGVISPSGQEVGPFLPIEQAALSGLVSIAGTESVRVVHARRRGCHGDRRTRRGLLTGAVFAAMPQAIDRYRAVVLVYAALGLVLALLFSRCRLPRCASRCAIRRSRRRQCC